METMMMRMMMMGYYSNTWVAMLMLIANVPIFVNERIFKNWQAEMQMAV